MESKGLGFSSSGNSHFVAAMEQVLDVYKRLYNTARPVVCIDETPKQLIKEVHKSLATIPGFYRRVVSEYS